jgi:putative transcriptional regulator
MKEMKEDVYNTLKVWRAKKNITQGELADFVGLSRQTINAIETKKYIPTVLSALKISKFFDTNLENIFTLEDLSND